MKLPSCENIIVDIIYAIDVIYINYAQVCGVAKINTNLFLNYAKISSLINHCLYCAAAMQYNAKRQCSMETYANL